MADVIRLTETPADIIAQAQNMSTAQDDEAPLQDRLAEAGSVPEQLLRQKIIEAISSVYDPEIPVNVYELGLIYELDIDDENNVGIAMTLTSPACPVAGILPGQVEQAVNAVPGVNNVQVHLVWDPPYNMHMMSEAAQLQLGLM
ncbi:MAG TPA: SUF system Fe-S cluster assembly protein [Abditibacteriaceae bacterium]|jgi:FeS assembly SUF system protein